MQALGIKRSYVNVSDSDKYSAGSVYTCCFYLGFRSRKSKTYTYDDLHARSCVLSVGEIRETRNITFYTLVCRYITVCIIHCRLSDTMGGIMSHLPFLRFVIPELSGYNELMSNLRRLWSFLGAEIAEHEASLPDDQPRDLIDAFLMEIKTKGASEDSIFDREFYILGMCI